MSFTTGRAAAACAVLLFVSLAPGAPLAHYTFTGESLASSDTDPNSVASTFNTGPGLFVGFDVLSGNVSRAVEAFSTTTTNEGGAILQNDYFEFTVTPEPTYQLNLTSLTLKYDSSFTIASRGFTIRSSIDTFATPLLQYSEAASSGTVNSFVDQSLTLGGETFEGVTSAVTFRIYVFDDNNTTTSHHRFDDIILNGEGVVPEPAAGALLLGSALLTLTRRRRQRDTRDGATAARGVAPR